MAYQPIVDLTKGTIFAYEALARPVDAPYPHPPALFAAAVEQRCVGALGRRVRQIAVSTVMETALFLNVHPAELDERWLVRPDDPMLSHDEHIYLEVTESVPLDRFERWRSVLNEVRGRGVRVAIDDLGADYSNLKYIADLEPHVVKLDRMLIQDLANRPRLRRLVGSLVRLCEEQGAKVVAEGIETADEFAAVVDAGAHYGQGYFIARPAFELVGLGGAPSPLTRPN